MMELKYIKSDPTKNITVLVETPVPEESQACAAEKIMELMPDCEQVGFIGDADGCDAALRMMGGEFCGNASLSLAALLSERGNTDGRFRLRVSGADEPVTVDIKKTSAGDYYGTVAMPLPLEIREYDFGRYTAPVVRFPGISHAIVERPMPAALCEMVIREWSAAVGAEAFGIMLLERGAGRLTPIVYVRSTDTVVRESSCASGTAAAAALAASKNGEASLRLTQPGGVMEAAASAADGLVTRLSLSAGVRIAGRGTVTIL
jgi:diaminopimelate epimerase